MPEDPNKQADGILAALEAQEGYETLAAGLGTYKTELEKNGFTEEQAMEIVLDFQRTLLWSRPQGPDA